MQSLDRLVSILETVATSERGLTASEVTKAMGLPMATVSRLMHVLADYDLLQRFGGQREYVLGPRLFALVGAATAQLDLVTVARPHLERVRDATEETTSLHVRLGNQRVCIVEVPSRHRLRRVAPVGKAEPLDASATSSVLLARMEEKDEIVAALDLTVKQRRILKKRVTHALEHAWALNVEEWLPDLVGLSAAVQDSDTTLGALSVSGPANRFTRERALAHVDTVLEAASRIAFQLGGGESG